MTKTLVLFHGDAMDLPGAPHPADHFRPTNPKPGEPSDGFFRDGDLLVFDNQAAAEQFLYVYSHLREGEALGKDPARTRWHFDYATVDDGADLSDIAGTARTKRKLPNSRNTKTIAPPEEKPPAGPSPSTATRGEGITNA